MSGIDEPASERALRLVQVFYADTKQFASFESIGSHDMPVGPRALLAHSNHMTLAMERFHGGPVGLIVVDRQHCEDGRYAREILLTAPDGRTVQYGIVRIDLSSLPEATAWAIQVESEPLGRILTKAGLLCDVHDVELLRVEFGPSFAAFFGNQHAPDTFGRVATIGLEGRPIIELLEIVAPGTA